ncbi:MAG: GtrA family protein [Janthinobacterium sp.]|jgi:putative flippase GtrA
MMAISSKMQYWLRFLAGGLLNTGLTYSLYFLLQKLFFYQLAYAIAYATGIVFSYWFNARIVFRTPLSWKGLMTYPLVYVVQYGSSALLLGIFIERLGIPPALAPLLVLVLMIPLTFFLSRWILRGRQHAS